MCRDPDNQTRFQAMAERCHATNAIARAQSSMTGDDVSRRATVWTATLPPDPPGST